MLVFILLLVLLYGAVWALFQLAAPVYRRALAGASETFCEARGKPVEFEVSGADLVFRSYSRPAFEADLSTEGVDSNAPFLLTLLLATPGMGWRNRAARMAAGLILLLASHALFVATKVEVTLLAAAHPLAGAAWFWNGADNFFEITGKTFFPVLIWLLFGFPYMMGLEDRPPPPRPQKAPGRNDPCPCGSGKKFKRCCGA